MTPARVRPVPLLVTAPADLFYLTGISLDGFWLLLNGDDRTVFAPRLIADQVRALLPQVPLVSSDRMLERFLGYCRANGIRRIGIDPARVSYGLAGKLEKSIRIENASEYFVEKRIVKAPEALRRIRQSCRITVSVFRQVKRLIRPGMSEIDIAFKIEEYFARNSVRPSFTTIVASGPNSANPHHISSTRKIQKNDIILIDMGCIHEGYASDLTRTFAIGKINYLYRAVHSLVARAHRAALNALKPGALACRVDGKARAVIAQAGYGGQFIHSTGHGVGIEVHEPPRLSPRDRTVLRAGMVVTVEPGVYLPGRFGVRIEDTVLVTNNGREELTR